MKIKKLTYSHKISGIFATLSALLCGILILSKGVPDLKMLTYAFSIIVPASLCAGFAGFLIGKIFDNENKKGSTGQFFK